MADEQLPETEIGHQQPLDKTVDSPAVPRITPPHEVFESKDFGTHLLNLHEEYKQSGDPEVLKLIIQHSKHVGISLRQLERWAERRKLAKTTPKMAYAIRQRKADEDRPMMNFDHAKYKRLLQAYSQALAEGKESFLFEGHEFLATYAKYLLEYLGNQFGKNERDAQCINPVDCYVDQGVGWLDKKVFTPLMGADPSAPMSAQLKVLKEERPFKNVLAGVYKWQVKWSDGTTETFQGTEDEAQNYVQQNTPRKEQERGQLKQQGEEQRIGQFSDAPLDKTLEKGDQFVDSVLGNEPEEERHNEFGECPWCGSKVVPQPTEEHLDEARFTFGQNPHAVESNPAMCPVCRRVGDWMDFVGSKLKRAAQHEQKKEEEKTDEGVHVKVVGPQSHDHLKKMLEKLRPNWKVHKAQTSAMSPPTMTNYNSAPTLKSPTLNTSTQTGTAVPVPAKPTLPPPPGKKWILDKTSNTWTLVPLDQSIQT